MDHTRQIYPEAANLNGDGTDRAMASQLDAALHLMDRAQAENDLRPLLAAFRAQRNQATAASLLAGLELARAYMAAGLWPLAISLLQDMLLDHRRVEVCLLLAESCWHAEQPANVLAACGLGLRLSPGHEALQRYQAMAHVVQGDLAAAATVVRNLPVGELPDQLHWTIDPSHCHDPVTGWATVSGLLRPGGTLHVTWQDVGTSIPQLVACLPLFGLAFAGFMLPADGKLDRLYRSRFPGETSGCDLNNWAALARENPAVMAGVTRFVCRKMGNPS